ncbi:hypothetical protein GALMADRAFT_212113 [Galerina marginata CBS 339.88]|uniref:Uncharacterized protein n=1 Tax=Galerina marginata (strain CBS 339.88) TaxID=685588 RepID=A0A067T4C1_GALM3|nr:hypothetical protein GALMADRAFT_212113 [Galerina marginata CBS 339.88]
MSQRETAIQQAVSTYFQNCDGDLPSVEEITRQVFLSLVDPDDIEEFNARRTYIELISTPSPEDIEEYCQILCLKEWAAGPAGGFYKRNKRSQLFSAEVLRMSYQTHMTHTRLNVEGFISGGLPVMQGILHDRAFRSSQAVDRIFRLRATWKIPIKGEVVMDESGRISKFVYAQSHGPPLDLTVQLAKAKDTYERVKYKKRVNGEFPALSSNADSHSAPRKNGVSDDKGMDVEPEPLRLVNHSANDAKMDVCAPPDMLVFKEIEKDLDVEMEATVQNYAPSETETPLSKSSTGTIDIDMDAGHIVVGTPQSEPMNVGMDIDTNPITLVPANTSFGLREETETEALDLKVDTNGVGLSEGLSADTSRLPVAVGAENNPNAEKSEAPIAKMNDSVMDIEQGNQIPASSQLPGNVTSGDSLVPSQLAALKSAVNQEKEIDARTEKSELEEDDKVEFDHHRLWRLSDKITKFTVPVTPAALLAYEFHHVPVDWDDISVPVIPRLEDEDRHDHDCKAALHSKTYEHDDAQRQRDELQSVYDAVDREWEAGHIKPKEGAKKVAELSAMLESMDAKLAQMKLCMDEAQKQFDHHFSLQMSVQKEAALAKEVQALQAEILTVPSDKLGETRAVLRKKVDALEVLSKKNAAEVASRAKNPKSTKSKSKKKAKDVDDPVVTITRYYKMDEQEQEDFEEKGRRYIRKYFTASTPAKKQTALKNIEVGIRRAGRDVQQFLPESAHLSIEVAIIFHLTSARNMVCRYHQRHRARTHHQHDTVISLAGVGYPRKLSSTDHEVPPPAGHMNCGCAVDDVLFEYFIWKTSSAFSTNPKLASTNYFMGDNDFVAPKIRRFWVQQWKDATCLTINDIYGNDTDTAGWIPRLAALSVIRQVSKLKGLGYAIRLDWTSEEGEMDVNKLIGEKTVAYTARELQWIQYLRDPASPPDPLLEFTDLESVARTRAVLEEADDTSAEDEARSNEQEYEQRKFWGKCKIPTVLPIYFYFDHKNGPHLPVCVDFRIFDHQFFYNDSHELNRVMKSGRGPIEFWHEDGTFRPFNPDVAFNCRYRDRLLILRRGGQPTDYVRNCIGFRELSYELYLSNTDLPFTPIKKGMAPRDLNGGLEIDGQWALARLEEDFADVECARGEEGEWVSDEHETYQWSEPIPIYLR